MSDRTTENSEIERLSGSTTYRWRCETPHDDHTLLKRLLRLPKDEIIRYTSLDGYHQDMVCELEAKSLTLDALRNLMRKVTDGHVMVQTVQPKDLYTGERNFEL